MKVILYTIHCPQCVVLEKKLKAKNIVYEEITDQNIMRKKGFLSSPILEVDGVIMQFEEANNWVNNI